MKLKLTDTSGASFDEQIAAKIELVKRLAERVSGIKEVIVI